MPVGPARRRSRRSCRASSRHARKNPCSRRGMGHGTPASSTKTAHHAATSWLTARTVPTSVRPTRSRAVSRGLSSGPTRRSNRTISTASTVRSPISKLGCDASFESTSMMARRRSASVMAPRPWASRNAASVRWVRARNHRRATAVASSKGRCCRPRRGLTATKLVSGQSGVMISAALETSARSSVWRAGRPRWSSFRLLMSIVWPAPRPAEGGEILARALPRSNCLGSSTLRRRAPR